MTAAATILPPPPPDDDDDDDDERTLVDGIVGAPADVPPPANDDDGLAERCTVVLAPAAVAILANEDGCRVVDWCGCWVRCCC